MSQAAAKQTFGECREGQIPSVLFFGRFAALLRYNFDTPSACYGVFDYLVKKYLHSTEHAKQVMGKLYSLMEILSVAETECVEALASAVSDYEDAVIERTAVREDVDYIITRNEKDYQLGMIKAIHPDDFINLF